MDETKKITEMDDSFIAAVRAYGWRFSMLINHAVNKERFLGNASTRCMHGFPSQKLGDVIFVSKRDKEYIDNVRVLTNISSGRLGALIAQKFSGNEKYKIWYLHGEDSSLPSSPNRGKPLAYIPVKSADDAMVNMRRIITEENIDVVIHAMAVSDFTFKKDSDIKLKSNDPDTFVEYMKETITPNPKIIGMIKDWNPTCILIGFKFEVDIDHSELIDLARESIQKKWM